jgi:hypothetical protein
MRISFRHPPCSQRRAIECMAVKAIVYRNAPQTASALTPYHFADPEFVERATINSCP